MTTIQDRIIKDFKKTFVHDSNGSVTANIIGGEEDDYELVEQFLIQSIKLVQEETRKEILNEVEEDCLFIGESESPSYGTEEYLAINEDSWNNIKNKYITNKEKQK